MGDRQFVGGSAAIHMRVMQNEILDMYEFAGHPERTGGVEEMAAFGKSLADRRAQHPLVQPRHCILRRGKGWKQG